MSMPQHTLTYTHIFNNMHVEEKENKKKNCCGVFPAPTPASQHFYYCVSNNIHVCVGKYGKYLSKMGKCVYILVFS